MTKNSGQIQHQEERLDEIDKQFYITAGCLSVIFQRAERLFEIANTSKKRQIVSLILSNLQLDDEKLIFNLKEPFDKLVNLSKGSYGWRKNTANEPCDNDKLHSFIKIYESIKADLPKTQSQLNSIVKPDNISLLHFI